MNNQEKSHTYPIKASDQIKYLKSLLDNSQFKISIIIPVYNVENYIRNALNSIVRQSIGLEHLEVIMVNDCSTDNSGKIMDEYANKYLNFKAIHLSENSGNCGKPRNIGIDNATGDYLMTLDPDDYYADNACEVLYNAVVEEDADIAFGKYALLKPNQTIETNYENKGFKDIDIVKVKTIDEYENLFRLPPSVPSKIIKRTLITDNNIRNRTDIPGEDFLFSLHALLTARGIIFLNNFVVFYYRMRDEEKKSLSFNYNKNLIFGLIKAYNDGLELLKKHGKEEYFPITIKDHLGYWLEKFSLSNLTYEDKMEILKKSELIFEKCRKGNVVPIYTSMIPVFNHVIHKQFEEAILLMDIQKSCIENQKKIISIIIPVFNVENYIRNALESILRQSIGFKCLEVIMINDSSIDKSGEIMEEYASKYDNFIAVHLSENSGAAGKPRNVGMELATADYIMFLDPDDYYSDDACEILYKKIIKENVDMVLGNYTINYENGRSIMPPTLQKKPFNVPEVRINEIDNERQFLCIPPSLWTKIFKRNFIIENGITFPEGIPGQDVGFVFHALLKAKGIIFINKNIVHYQVRNSEYKSITFNRNKKYLLGLIKAHLYSYEISKDNEEYFSYIIRNHLIYLVNQYILSDLSVSDKKEVLRSSWFLFKKYMDYELVPIQKHLMPIIESIAEKRYDDTIYLCDKLKSSMRAQENVNQLKSDNLGKILMLCDKVHIELGGLARVVLTRSQILAEKGYDVDILTIEPDNDYESIENELKKRGQLSPDVNLINIYNYYRNKNTGEISLKYLNNIEEASEIHENGYQFIDEYHDKKITRYFHEGKLIMIKKWSDNSLLKFIEYFDENGVRVKRKEYMGGFLTKEIVYQHYDKIRRKRHFTKDGFCYFTEMFDYNGQEKELFLFDKNSDEVISFNNSIEFHKYFLTEICNASEEKPYLICDGSGPTPTISNIKSNVAYKICQLHSNPYTGPYSFGGPMRNIGILENIGDVDAFITLTEKQRNEIIKEFGDYKNTYTIPNFVSKSKLQKLRKKSNKITIFSRISHEKNVKDCIEAFKLVVDKRNDAILEIFGRATLPGEIEELKKIQKLIKELKLEKNVFIKGYTTNVYQEMEESIATLLTSKFEGFGMVIIESMLNSTPVISYDINYGPSDIIDHKINGFLVKPNDIEQMGKYIIELLDNPEKAKKMGAAAREKVLNHYTDDIVIPQWEKIFKTIPHIKKNKIIDNCKINKFEKLQSTTPKKENLKLLNILKNRNFTQKLISKLYPLYILVNGKNHSLKEALLNIKGYRSIKKNNLLDFDYYLYNNDVKESGMDPILHYIYHGFKEGRNPNPNFDGNYYLNKYGHIKKSNLNPLVHYALYGINEGRETKGN